VSRLWLLAAACAAACRVAPSAPARPNVLLVTLDTTRAEHLGAYGATGAATPAFDRIAHEGLLFTSAWTVTPLTTPAHASSMTGLYPQAHGVRNNGRFRLPGEVKTLASVLAGAGYRTGAFVGAFTVSRPFGFAAGFERFDDDFGTDGHGRARSERRADEVDTRALAWLTEAVRGPAPFFAWLHYYDAHDPNEPPIAETFRGRLYDGEIASADAALGRVLEFLGQAGVLDATVVVVAGDHGEGLGDHGEPTHGLLLYEPTIHVPLAIRAPWTVPAGSRHREPMSLVDLAPTIAALAHVDFADVDGLDVLGGEAPGEASRDVYAESLFAAEDFGWAPLFALRRGEAKWIAAPHPERYDLARDPHETENLAGRNTVADDAMRKALAALRDRRATHGGPAAALDDEMLARLQSLGYVGNGGAGAPRRETPSPGRDPKDGLRDYDDYLRGTEALNAGDDAVLLFARLVESDPSNPEFRLRLGQALRGRGDAAGAEAAYRELIRRYPDFYLAYRRLTALLTSQGRAVESRDLWLAFKARGSAFVGVDARLAESYLAHDETDAALASARRGLTASPEDAELLVLAARALERLGRDGEALASYRQALAVKPSDLTALDGALAVLARLGRPAEAKALVQDCLGRSAGNPAVASRLAGI
jgi:arylsulfatase A-like enzyme/cytochrome c-type biogenesis protein CcmH/NrfG